MARTPLLSSIRQLARELRAARAAGVPVDELREQRAAVRAERGPSRRQFLAGAGAAAALVAAPRLARAGKGDPVIAIVGGGIAGLNCARELADRNIAATVYEAAGRVGGRMFSNRTGYWAGGQVSEWCGELIDTGHTTVRKLAKRFGLPLDDLHAAEPTGSTETYRFGNAYYPKAQADADFLAMFGTVDADVTAAGYPTTFDAYTTAGLALDQLSVYDWIESRVPGGHASPLGQLLDAAYAIEYGADTTDQSSLSLLYLLGFQPTSTGLDVFGESDERFHVRGGNEQLPEAIAGSLGSAVVTGHKLVRLKKTAGDRYQLTFDRASTTTTITADYVVLALPFAVLDGIDTTGADFDALKRQAITELGRGHNGKLQLQFDRRGWLGAGPWPGSANGSTYSDTGYQASWEVSRAQPGKPGILVLYSGGSVTDGMHTTAAFATATDARVRQDATRGLAQLAPVFPGLAHNGRTTQSLPHRSPFFGASYSYWKVGQYIGFSGYEKVRQGGVLFCGEHTSQDFQGYMEGGASEGERAAKQLARLLGRP
jgi:monoamine oxidase